MSAHPILQVAITKEEIKTKKSHIFHKACVVPVFPMSTQIAGVLLPPTVEECE